MLKLTKYVLNMLTVKFENGHYSNNLKFLAKNLELTHITMEIFYMNQI